MSAERDCFNINHRFLKQVTITSIEPQKRRSGRFSVFIDGEFAFGMDGADVLFYKLAEGEEISKERLDYILSEVVFVNARDTALRYLGARQSSEALVRLRLERDEYPPDIIDRVADTLKEYGYIDDKAFALMFTEQKAIMENMGLRRVYWELKQRGVDESIIDAAVEELKVDEEKSAAAALEAKLRGRALPADKKERGKLFSYMANRGFPRDVIMSAFDAAQTTDEQDDEDE